MKFARYLEETQIPEWKKAYIDYRGLKKRITAIRRAQHSETDDGPSDESQEQEDPLREVSDGGSIHNYGSTGNTPRASSTSVHIPRPPPVPIIRAERNTEIGSDSNNGSLSVPAIPQSIDKLSGHRRNTEAQVTMRKSHVSIFSSTAAQPAEHGQSEAHESSGFLSSLRRRRSWYSRGRETSDASRNLPLSAIFSTLSPIQLKFFDALDKELEKIDDFYRAREHENLLKSAALKEQLRELKDHRRVFHETHHEPMLGSFRIPLPNVVIDRISVAAKIPLAGNSKHQKSEDQHEQSPISPRSHTTKANVEAASLKMKLAKVSKNIRSRDSSPDSLIRVAAASHDPVEYKSAKKHLKKAILEYYRGLELLNDYRVLNITGFRKALKKFDKAAGINIQDAYMREKIEPSAFASGTVVEQLMKEIEVLYAARFERGDMKKARSRLRATMKHRSHHFSTFRTGIYIGLAIPAFISGLYESFQPETRADLPWNSLLLIYATFLIPVLFSLLVGTNVLVWSRSRINYGFIFDLDVRTQLDSREYFELPSFLLCTLCYAFWLTFNRIGENNVAPTTWPMAWLVFALAVMFNPIPLLFPSSRWWLLRKVSKLLISGTRPVEFTDFWMGDEFCSLAFTLSNLYFVGCVYDSGWNNALVNCSTTGRWAVPFVLAAIPIIARAVQSVKRYNDSKLITHLINAGKYVSNTLYYALLFYWRHRGMPRNSLLAVFCVFATLYSTYTASWDILMDWSLFKRPAQHKFLRPTLIYSNYYYMYYFAIITNIAIRFIWIIYIPSNGPNMTIRTFIAAFLEMLRRWQWNFFRLENEHIGNTDQYRVTREIPLPYSFHDARDDGESDDGGDEDDNEQYNSDTRRNRKVPMTTFSHDREHHGNETATSDRAMT